jgi:alpha-tubulin suppressor-like RCC1 family protein
VQVGADTNWSLVNFGYLAVAAIKTTGSLWTWGWNPAGDLGQNDRFVSRCTPSQVGTDTNWSQIVVNERFMMAIRTNGTLWAWGNNRGGHLGQNDRVYRSSPTQVGAGTTWVEIGSGSEISFAITLG